MRNLPAAHGQRGLGVPALRACPLLRAYLLFRDAALLAVAPTSTMSQTHLDCPRRFLLENDISILMQNACKTSMFFTTLTSPQVWVGAWQAGALRGGCCWGGAGRSRPQHRLRAGAACSHQRGGSTVLSSWLQLGQGWSCLDPWQTYGAGTAGVPGDGSHVAGSDAATQRACWSVRAHCSARRRKVLK